MLKNLKLDCFYFILEMYVKVAMRCNEKGRKYLNKSDRYIEKTKELIDKINAEEA